MRDQVKHIGDEGEPIVNACDHSGVYSTLDSPRDEQIRLCQIAVDDAKRELEKATAGGVEETCSPDEVWTATPLGKQRPKPNAVILNRRWAERYVREGKGELIAIPWRRVATRPLVLAVFQKLIARDGTL